MNESRLRAPITGYLAEVAAIDQSPDCPWRLGIVLPKIVAEAHNLIPAMPHWRLAHPH